MTATNKPYTDLETVRMLLDKDPSSTADDDLIESLIPQAQAVIDSFLGYSFQTDTTSRLYDGNGRDKLLIDKCLILTKVEVVTYTAANNVRTEASAQDISGYCLLDRTGLLLTREFGYLPLGRRNIRVTGTFGKYDRVPDDIQRAAGRLVVHYVKQRDASYQNTTANTQFGQLVFQQDIPSDICKILEKHVQRVFLMR